MDEKIKTWTLRFRAKENPNMEKALFDWPIVLCPFFLVPRPLISSDSKYSTSGTYTTSGSKYSTFP